jgi:hypothetical protein
VRGTDGDGEVGRLAANALVKGRVTVLGTHRVVDGECEVVRLPSGWSAPVTGALGTHRQPPAQALIDQMIGEWLLAGLGEHVAGQRPV